MIINMDGIIGRIQTEADFNGKRNDIQLETSISAIKTEDGESIKSIVENMGLSATLSKTKPDHSSVWFMLE
jgi:hypothetical protein